jgi:hypothetical protein
MTKRIKEVMQTILKTFESGDVPEAIAYSVFPSASIPSSEWSLLNRILMFFAGTKDARGFRQWREAKRYVKKGAKAFYILVPRIMKRENEEGEEILTGFMARPVFRLEDTEGEPLDYQKIELHDIPLIEKAKKWGISVKAIPGNYSYYGYFSSFKKEIALATKAETVFFHELAHAAHQKVIGDLNKESMWRKEITAELASTVLLRRISIID